MTASEWFPEYSATRRRGEEAKRRRGNRNRTASFLPDDELRTLSAATAQPLPAHDLWTLTHLTLCLAPSWTTRFRRHPESSESLRPLKRPEALFLLNAVG
ncbi:hypothetical protein Cob_v003981 [Colletotrichum orbiculare MAFF 240422]|uniref:Uncharacterized protein n=1 Tax=Colletotrichum orbiculare (strain 104-T / ATCC 96160 / CBS 514.97 / LARS 414 / MAFF 240422) TaxID=1213857 RepID=A0A484FYB5_COLOR|nr:hypothetical protein Cob_v003981 [Colletotrichum orbiculare MAFF 240422]